MTAAPNQRFLSVTLTPLGCLTLSQVASVPTTE